MVDIYYMNLPQCWVKRKKKIKPRPLSPKKPEKCTAMFFLLKNVNRIIYNYQRMNWQLFHFKSNGEKQKQKKQSLFCWSLTIFCPHPHIFTCYFFSIIQYFVINHDVHVTFVLDYLPMANVLWKYWKPIYPV